MTSTNPIRATLAFWDRLRAMERQYGQPAPCRREDPELFFPVGTGSSAQKQIKQAKAVCGRCLMRSVCRDWALETGVDDGVWGGLSEDERRALKRSAAPVRVVA